MSRQRWVGRAYMHAQVDFLRHDEFMLRTTVQSPARSSGEAPGASETADPFALIRTRGDSQREEWHCWAGSGLEKSLLLDTLGSIQVLGAKSIKRGSVGAHEAIASTAD